MTKKGINASEALLELGPFDMVGIGISHWTRKAFKQVPPGWMTVLKGDSWPDMKGKGREKGQTVAEARPMKKSPASSCVQVLFTAFLNLENDSTSRCGSITPQLVTYLVSTPTLDPPVRWTCWRHQRFQQQMWRHPSKWSRRFKQLR